MSLKIAPNYALVAFLANSSIAIIDAIEARFSPPTHRGAAGFLNSY
jgi:hypothetical protein